MSIIRLLAAGIASLVSPLVILTGSAAEAAANSLDAAGNTPLHLAALRADADAVDALLARGKILTP